MKRAVKKLLIATSIAAGMGGIFTAPALAGSLTGASIGGSAKHYDIGDPASKKNDYLIYGSDGTNTSTKTDQTLQEVLGGNAGNPTGNVELAARSEQPGFDFTNDFTTLTGEIGGKDIILSSLTMKDWNTDVGGMSFGQRWFDEVLMANGFDRLVGNASIYNIFKSQGGFQRFSDPNISYVNQDSSGDINIGLAGHFDATNLLMEALSIDNPGLINLFRNRSERGKPIQVSEIVKVSYDGGDFQYLYSFDGDPSNLINSEDGRSHDGNYEVTLKSNGAATVPEPSVMLGLLSVGGIFASKRRKKKA